MVALKVSSGGKKKEMTDKFLSLPKVNLGENWMKEIDVIEHENMLIRNKESNWDEILYGIKILNIKNAIKIKNIMKNFRKEV